jgi:hypothetical protein
MLASAGRASALPWTLSAPLRTSVAVQVETWDTGPSDLERLRAMGISTVRWGVAWSQVESRPGVYDWREPDRFMRLLDQAGMRSVVILGGDNPAWGPGSPATPASRAAFSAFAAAAVARYGANHAVWEIWNEPDLPRFWTPGPDALAYARLAQAACQAIKQKTPGAMVIGPAGASLPEPERPTSLFLYQALQTSGGWACLDAASAHFYGLETGRPQPAPEEMAARVASAARWVRRVTAHLLLCTEWGRSESHLDPPRASDPVKMILLNRASGVPLTVLYQWRDHGEAESDPEDHFGLVDVYGRDKGGATVLAAFLATAGSATRVERLDMHDADDMVMELGFPNGSRQLVAWTVAAGPPRDLSIDGRKVLRLDATPRFTALGGQRPNVAVGADWGWLFEPPAP